MHSIHSLLSLLAFFRKKKTNHKTIILTQKEKSRDKAMHPMNFFYSNLDIQYFSKWVVYER